MRKSIKILLLSILFCLGYSRVASAEIIFQDNFNHYNGTGWTPSTTANAGTISGGTLQNPGRQEPYNWTGWIRSGGDYIGISPNEGPDNSACFKVSNQITSQAGQVGLVKYLGENGYSELYVSFDMKFDNNHRFGNGVNGSFNFYKVLRFWQGLTNQSIYDGTGPNSELGKGAIIWGIYDNAYAEFAPYFAVGGMRDAVHETVNCSSNQSCDIFYYYPYSSSNKGGHLAPWFGQVDSKGYWVDQQTWHHITVHVKLASTFGGNDGIVEQYVDGVKQNNFTWVQLGSNGQTLTTESLPTAKVGKGINYIVLNDNRDGTNSWTTPSYVMYDNFVISTTYDNSNGSSVSSTCTSFVYSEWSACQPNNTRTRTVSSSLPSGCIGGNPVVSETCQYIAPTCSYTYSPWGACQSNNIQTRTVTSTSPANCTGGQAVLTQTCNYVAPSTGTETCNYTYSSWGACQPDGTQTRTLTKVFSNCSNNPILSQRCNYKAPNCSYTFSTWNTCNFDGYQTRTISGKKPDNCAGNPALKQQCVYTSSTPIKIAPETATCIVSPGGGNYFNSQDIEVNCGDNTLDSTYQWDNGVKTSFSGKSKVFFEAKKSQRLIVNYRYRRSVGNKVYFSQGTASRTFSANQNICKITPEGGTFAEGIRGTIECGSGVKSASYKWDNASSTSFTTNTSFFFEGLKSQKLTVNYSYQDKVGDKVIERTGVLVRFFNFQKCVDGDDAKDFYKSATVDFYKNTTFKKYTDTCSNGYLTEYYCDKNNAYSVRTKCVGACVDGACVQTR